MFLCLFGSFALYDFLFLCLKLYGFVEMTSKFPIFGFKEIFRLLFLNLLIIIRFMVHWGFNCCFNRLLSSFLT